MYVAVMLRNVNLCSCSEIGRHWNIHYTRTSMKKEVSWRWRTGGQRGWAFALYVFGGVKCTNECWTQPMAGNSDKEKAKRSVHRRSQESKKRTRKSSKVESTYWTVFTSQVLFFRLPLLNQQCPFSDTCSMRPTHMCNVQTRTGTWRGTRCHMHAYS